MKRLHSVLAISGAVVTAVLVAGCGSDTSNDNPTTSGVVTTGVSTSPATSSAPPPVDTSVAPQTTAPATGGSQSPTTQLNPSGPSQTVSGGNSVSPPPVQQPPSPPTGDNLPGENAGPEGRPGAPGRN